MCVASATSGDFLFLEAVRDAYLTQHIEVPTRGRGTDKPTTLDLLITNDDALVEDLIVGAPVGKSDHAVISVNIVCDLEMKPISKKRFMYDKANYDDMRKVLDINWEENLKSCGDDVNKMWAMFKSKMKEAEELIPSTVVTINGKNKKYKTPLDRKSLAKIKRKNRLWDRYCKTSSGQAYLEYCRTINQVRSLTRKAPKAVEKSIAENAKSNPKKFWQFVGNKTKNKASIPDLVCEDEETGENNDYKTTSGDKEKAEVLNKYFSTLFTVEKTVYDKVIPNKTESKLLNIEVTQDIVKKKLSKLKIGKNPGPDGIHPRVLKELLEVISLPLTIIFKTSIAHGKLPDEWKNANVTAIYKKETDKYQEIIDL